MPVENGTYTSEIPHRRDSFSLTEIDGVVSGTIKRVQKLLDAQTWEFFNSVELSLRKDLNRAGFTPIDIGLGGRELVSNRLKIHEDITLHDLIMTIGLYLTTHQNVNQKGPTGKFTKWGKPYTGKRRNRIRV